MSGPHAGEVQLPQLCMQQYCTSDKVDARTVPGHWDALGSSTWTPTLGGALLSPDIHLEHLERQLAGHCQEDS